MNNPNATLMVGTYVRLPTFNGNGTEDLEQHWFLYEEVWTICLVKNDDIQKAQIITTLWGHALDWYMKYCVVPLRQPKRTLEEIRRAMISKFRKPQSESQCITNIKDIKQAPTEIVWDFDQRFKTMMAKASFQMSDVQHKEWFISALLPHIRGPLIQQNIVM